MSIVKKFKSLFAGRDYASMRLADIVTLAADEPTFANRDAFYRRLIVSKVGARVDNPNLSLRPGDHIVSTDDELRIPTSKGPDGNQYLVVFCDIPGMFRAFPKDLFFEVEARVVLQMAKSIGGGVVVQNSLDGRESWAAVPREHVDALLSRQTHG